MSSTDRRPGLPPSLLESTAAMMRADLDAFHAALVEAGLIAPLTPPPPRFNVKAGVLTALNEQGEAMLAQMSEAEKAAMIRNATTYSALAKPLPVDMTKVDLPLPDPFPDAKPDEDNWETFIVALACARTARARIGDPILPTEVADAVRVGLKRAGIRDAKPGTVFESGKFARTRPMLIQFPCLSWHRTEDRSDFETVRLIVEEHPSEDRREVHARHLLTRHGTSCEACQHFDWDGWLLTPDPMRVDGDGLPLAPVDFIVAEVRAIEADAVGRWWRDHPEDAAAAERVTLGRIAPDGYRRPDGTPVPVEDILTERRRWWLGKIRKKSAASSPPSSSVEPRASWTVDSAARWLDGLTDDDGAPLVPVGLGLRKVWEVVKDIEPHPPRSVVRDAQKARQDAGSAEAG